MFFNNVERSAYVELFFDELSITVLRQAQHDWTFNHHAHTREECYWVMLKICHVRTKNYSYSIASCDNLLTHYFFSLTFHSNYFSRQQASAQCLFCDTLDYGKKSNQGFLLPKWCQSPMNLSWTTGSLRPCSVQALSKHASDFSLSLIYITTAPLFEYAVFYCFAAPLSQHLV